MTNTTDNHIKQKSLLGPPIWVNANRPGSYNNAPNEQVWQTDINATIILGPATKNTPEIAKTKNTATITLVAGMTTAIKGKQPPVDAAKLELSNKFYYDSAVLQISEQTDVDANFGARIVDKNAKNASAVAIKADEVRLYSRGSCKIITGMDQMDKDQVTKDANAPIHPNRDFSGIHLIANNAVDTEEQLQPLVLGRNLEDFLNKILDEIKNIHAKIKEVFDAQSIINEALRDHTHISDFTASPLPPWTDPKMLASVEQGQARINILTELITSTKTIPNIENLRNNYLVKNPNKYINSYYNKTN
jgi:hypothetical protein